jgi:hypothetical protein
MSDSSISWIGLAISVVLMIDKMISKSKKVKCKCCGCSEFEADASPQTPKMKKQPPTKDDSENIEITVS